MQSRAYQERTIAKVFGNWSHGVKSQVIVSPTGSGKTYMGALCVRESKTLWVTPRRELVKQSAKALGEMYGMHNVGVIMPGNYPNPSARIQVGTVQTLLARGLPEFELIVLDEAHHFTAEEWRAVAEHNPEARTLGLTATPEREQGDPLGDIFQDMIVSAHYPELVKLGFIVPWNIFRPGEDLGNDLALDPLLAYQQHGNGGKAFVFAGRVLAALEEASRFRSRGIAAKAILGDTPKTDRDAAIDRFKGGSLNVLTNVTALTEGVDVTDASVIVLMRNCAYAGTYLQICGRGGRAHEGKTHATLIDLCGASIRHGSPVAERSYSLTGKAITGIEGHGGGGGHDWSQGVKDTGLVLDPASVSYGVQLTSNEATAFRPRSKAEKIELKVQAIAAKHGVKAAESMRALLGGMTQ